MRLILASNSPRRKDLMKQAGLDFSVKTSNINERLIEDKLLKNIYEKKPYEQAHDLTRKLSFEKANAALMEICCDNDLECENIVVIGSDTVVVCEEKILGKPLSRQDAYDTLVYLCGKKHRVYTSFCLLSKNKKRIVTSYTEVEFYKYDDKTKDIIKKYVESGAPLDKAGSYGIQDYGSLLVKEIKGDYYTVVGFPISSVYRELKSIDNSET
ncbi:Maf family protein [Peptostreptococcus sp. D1]|uniref:Maf family protein n=1 Tax=Peptostreptococcus sp. D1 TaxID=72304 RepID=UPI0008E2D6E6|nr:Maf family protein [Peptostreptococcus sp. D1]SFE32574.1 septum formation protein [Peptostreptococcus sp. D1]